MEIHEVWGGFGVIGKTKLWDLEKDGENEEGGGVFCVGVDLELDLERDHEFWASQEGDQGVGGPEKETEGGGDKTQEGGQGRRKETFKRI